VRNVKRLQNVVRAAAMGAQNGHADPKIGLVTGYDPARYAVKVTLQPAGNITGWLPLGAVWVGAGWGLYAPPSIGDMVMVDFAEGHGEAGHVALRFFNDVDQALPVTSGEFWLVHKSGAYFKLLNTGALALSDGKGAAVTMNGDGTMSSTASAWTHTGNMMVTGTLTATTDVIAAGKHLVSHVHTGGTISGDTGIPL
jgi:hypothetical protein